MSKDGGVIPVTGCPMRRRYQARETTNIHERIQHPNMHLIQHAFVRGGRLGVIPSRRDFSERIKFVAEVDVLATFVVVVVVLMP